MDEDQANHRPCFHLVLMTLHLRFSFSFLLLSVVDKDTFAIEIMWIQNTNTSVSPEGDLSITQSPGGHQQHIQGQSICVCFLVITSKHFKTVAGNYIFGHLGAFSEESMLAFLRISLNFSPLLFLQEVFGNGNVSEYIKNGGFIGG